MGLIENFINRLRFGSEDADDYEDDADENNVEYEEEVEEREEKPIRRPSFASEKTSFFSRQKTNTQTKNAMKLVLVKPNSFEDVLDICNPLLDGKVVVINMEGMHGDISRRIIDFVSGSTYSIKGNLQKISNYIVVATPASVELSGEFADVLSNAYDSMGFNLKV